MGGKTWDQQQEWAQEVLNVRGDRGSAVEWPLIHGAVAKKLRVYLVPSAKPDRHTPGLRLGSAAKPFDFAILAQTLDLADFGSPPRGGQHALSVASEAGGQTSAWGWIYDQVRTGVRDP